LLVVDDDSTVLGTLRDFLQPWGFHLTTLEDPRQFWTTLEAVLPDLLVMDINMPHVDGIELCQVVRNDPQWNWLPILFLTAQSDATTIQRVFAAGADDYIIKPIAGPELVTRIHNRLERTKLLRSMAEIDALTGTVNRQKSTQDLQRFLQWAHQHHHSLCLSVIDLDCCKQINERYGHAVGDRLLQRVGKVLRQLFRGDDVVSRWSGATFVVGMYNMSRWDGVERLAEALELLQRETQQEMEGYSGPISLSAGVAEYPADGSDLQSLYHAALQALRGAKESGGARIYPVGWTPLTTENPLFDLVLIQAGETAAALQAALMLRGYHVQWLPDFETLKSTLGKDGKGLQGRLILLDTELPKLSTEKFLKQLSRQRQLQGKRLLVFVNQSEVAEQFLQKGAYDYLIKPYKLPILLQRVRRALET
ncbi:MAG: response regulator, partial [Leptolyngbyaceae cyanobacterium bins.59]|nr:response regulator [Leptolyngbyaceae cyanobacterium bins.59]